MAQILKLRRSNIPGKIPDTSSLDFGELALNTYDGLAFMKKSGSNGEEIVSIGSTSGSFSGSLFGTASWAQNAISASYALTASFSTTASYVLNAISASWATSASRAINSISSSYPITITGSTLRSVNPQGGVGATTLNGVFIGNNAGNNATNANGSNFIGSSAGNGATYANGSNFLGSSAGSSAIYAGASNFLGSSAGYFATYANGSNFLGNSAGLAAFSASYSNFLGKSAGFNANSANNSNFIGYEAGAQATFAIHSNFFGTNAGLYAVSASYSTLIGYNVGYNGVLGIKSNNIIIGTNITLANERQDSINIGGLIFGTGSYSTTTGNPFSGSANGRIGINQPLPLFSLDVSGSGRYTNGLDVTGSLNAPVITGSLFGTASWANNVISASQAQNAVSASYVLSSSFATTASYAINAISSSYPIAISGSTIYTPFDVGNFNTDNSIFLGYGAGSGSDNGFNNAARSNFIGYQAGYEAISAGASNFLGPTAGYQATNANSSNFLGAQAGYQATNAQYSNFLSNNAGYQATNAAYSNFLGREAGYGATNSGSSHFLGFRAGYQATSASLSTFIGYRAGANGAGGDLGVKSNNIIIGTNITLEDGRQDSINIGGLIFGTGSYADLGNPFSITPFSGSANGRIGINQPLPIYSLDVSGSGRYTDGLDVTGSLNAPVITGSLFGTASWANNVLTASYVNPLNQQVIITGSLIQGLEGNIATGEYSHAEGSITKATGDYSHAEGDYTQAIGSYSHAEGQETIASGAYSHAEGYQTIALANHQHVQGQWNATSSISFAFIVGNGTDDSNRSNLIHAAGNEVQISGSLIVNGGITGSLFGTASWTQNTISASYALNSNLLDGLDSTIFATTGSNIFKGNQTITGSLNISGSTTQIGDNTLLGNTLLSGSIIISGSNQPGYTTPSVQIYGDIRQTGYHRFDPVTTNIDTSISASYIYVSGSTNDLYFSQNGAGYANTTRLRWLEGNLYTGLLNGGIITAATGSTVYQVSSGSGIIVDLNASLSDNPYPTIQYLNWGNLTGDISPLTASYQQAFVSIDSTGNIYQQGTPYAAGQFDTEINIGLVLFQNGSTINGVKTQPSLAYGFEQQQNIFNRAFGPLKLSGYTLAPSASSVGSLIVAGGTAYSPGSNYSIDPNNPSYTTDSGTNVSKIFRYRQSGSTWVYDTNGGAGYTAIDPTQYSNNGVLTAVPGGGSNRQWSIQRVFYFPNSVAKAIVVYYGNAVYTTQTDATSNIPYEPFVEAPNTAANAIYLGAIVVRNNADFTVDASYNIQPGGLFRQVGGSGGGGSVITQTLSGLSDVLISGPTSGQALVYDTTAAKWENKSFISASISGNAATATTATSASFASTASFAQTAQTASYVLNAVSASYALSASQAQNAVTASYVLNAVSSSFAATASSADNFTVRGTLTAQTIVAQTITSSTLFVTGSTRFGSLSSSLHQFTGSVRVSGSMTVSGAPLPLLTPPSNFSASIDYNNDPDGYDNGGFTTSFRIYLYKNTLLGKNYSSYTEVSVTDNGENTTRYVINLTWTSNPNADGYLILIQNDYNGYNFDRGYSTTSTSLQVDQGNPSWDSVPTITSLLQPPNTLNVFGDTNITGAININQKAFILDYNDNVVIGTSNYTASGNTNNIFIGQLAGYQATTTEYSTFIGTNAGYQATNAAHSTFIGYSAGYQATTADFSMFIGNNAGGLATNAGNSNFVGQETGYRATNAYDSNFLGFAAGNDAPNASNSNFIGRGAGSSATNAAESNFIGRFAGLSATNASGSNFIGKGAGQSALSASYSNLIGWQAGSRITGTGIGTNNIIIGTNITLPDSRRDSINLGGIIFATGSYSTTTGNPFSGSANGRVGINQPLPIFSLDVSGSGRYTNGLIITGSISVNDSFNINVATFNSTSSVSNIGNSIVSSIVTGSATSVFYNYTIASGSNARSGQIMTVWNNNVIKYTEVSTTDIGNTSNALFNVALSGSSIQLNFSASGVWVVKSVANLL